MFPSFSSFGGFQLTCCAPPTSTSEEVSIGPSSDAMRISEALLLLSGTAAAEALEEVGADADAHGGAPPEGGVTSRGAQATAAGGPMLLGALRPERNKMSTGNLSLAGASAQSTAADAAELAGASSIGSDTPGSPRSSATPLGFSEGSGALFTRSESFEVDLAELPDLVVPEREVPLVSGRLAVRFRDLEKAIFAESGGPLVAFLQHVMGCREISAGPWLEHVRDETGSGSQQLQRSQYQLPLPDDVPEVAARLLGLGKSVSSSTFTRISRNNGHIILQQSSRTEGLLYSERMRVINIHLLEADSSGDVAWRSWTHIAWSKALPWTHSFIGRIIDNRVKAETKANAPKLMRVLGEAAANVGRSSRI